MATAINIIGSGHVGRTLARLWHDTNTLSINQIYNRNLHTSNDAVAFIGAGVAVKSIEEFSHARLWMITTPDAVLKSTAEQLARLPLPWHHAIVWHCSGAHSAELLAPLQALGAQTASVHPLHSFANPAASLRALPGCYCSAEGEITALTELKPLFEAVGLRWFWINPQQKLNYHAAAVFACNYITTLMAAADACLHAAGVQSNNATALEVLLPLVRQTLDNIVTVGPKAALSGPVKRAESQLIQQQYRAVNDMDPMLGELYATLAWHTLGLTDHKQTNAEFVDALNALAKAAKNTN